MTIQRVDIGRVNIGDGFFATDAWINNGPIVMIAAKSDDSPEQRSRLDLQKRMLIDPLPGKRDTDGITQLVRAIIDAQRSHGDGTRPLKRVI